MTSIRQTSLGRVDPRLPRVRAAGDKCPRPAYSARPQSGNRSIRADRRQLSGSYIAHLWKAATQQHHRALLPLIRRLLPADGVVFDVGAHAGQFAKLFARAAPRGRIYAIEPGSYARSILRTALWLRGFDNVTVLPLALGSQPGLARLTMPVKASGANAFGLTHLGAPESRWAANRTELVAQATVDQLVAALALDRLDLIKADIEGWETQMLAGAADALDRFRPRLLLELNEAHLARAGDTVAGAFAFMAAHRYRGFTFHGPAALAPVPSPGGGDVWFLPDEDPMIPAVAGESC